jgi:uncharacterized repeat protein (TIGR03803 family)
MKQPRRLVATFLSAALLAGCGGSSFSSPTPSSVGPQSRSRAALGHALHRVRNAAWTETVLHSFAGGADGEQPDAGMTNVNGTLYGTTEFGGRGGVSYGAVFAITRSGTESVLYSFAGGKDGAYPTAGLTNVNGTLYGTTTEGGSGKAGTVFKITTSGTYSVLYSFKSGTDGADPTAGLTNVKGTLYGTTFGGGANKAGTVFKITTSGAETVLYSFKGGMDGSGPYAGLTNVNGTFYGTTSGALHGPYGTVFKITTSGKETVLHNFAGTPDGANPYAGLLNVSGALYGTTEYGGAHCRANGKNCGTVFAITTSGAETVLYSFAGGTDGQHPYAGLTNLSGTLYGTTDSGGTSGDGTVFNVTTYGTEAVVYSFAGGTDGQGPGYGALTNINGTLYGTTMLGGSSGYGTVFSLSVSATETVLYSFGGTPDGANPNYGDLIDVNGELYGNTITGGANGSACPAIGYSAEGCGTVFEVNPSSGAESVLHSFNVSPDGTNPWSGLVNMNGTLYGTTFEGGTGTYCDNPPLPIACGTVFEVSTSGAEQVIYSFQGDTDGQFPQGSLIAVDGALYGSTNTGGTKGHGTIFKISASGAESIIYSFKGSPDGANPEAPLTDVNGELYGTTGSGGAGCASSGVPGCGTIFKVSTSGTEKVLYRFKDSPDGGGGDGAGAAMIDVGGVLYGTTAGGGTGCSSSGGCGTVFKVSTSGAESVLHSFKGGADGAQPLAGLIDVKGTLYGTTQVGGSGCASGGCGTIFAINPSTGAERVVYSFAAGTDGAYPQSGLTAVNGVLYGTTHNGGSAGFGTVYSLSGF